MASDSDYQRWAKGIRQRDEGAFHELFEASYKPLMRYARTFIHDFDAASDVLQDVYTYLWQIRERVDEKKSLKALLYHITKNRCLNHLGVNRPGRLDDVIASEIPRAEMEPDMFDDPEEQELSLLITEWIEQLPQRRREAFELSRFEGLDHNEIARVMDCSPRTVNNHIVQALEFLRSQLALWKKNKKLREGLTS
ncbi:RNA polymerase sigma-70 factor [Balneolaceae bacterium ANBcel3]|nr:RNA polymerase sigma-70 factor [Balneolaceae bacterium ANBcel3]